MSSWRSTFLLSILVIMAGAVAIALINNSAQLALERSKQNFILQLAPHRPGPLLPDKL